MSKEGYRSDLATIIATISASMPLLLVSALLGGILTVTLFWFWQGSLVVAFLVAPFGGSFAALLAAVFLAFVRSSSFRALFAFRSKKTETMHSGSDFLF
jgi:type IV secretory pathway TrbL component